MGTGNGTRLCALAILVALGVAILAGCGDDAGAEEQRTGGVTEAFIDLVSDFEEAARTGEELEAIERSKEDLEPRETKAFWAFCETLWSLDLNAETERFANPDYVIARTKKLAEYRFANKDSPTVAAALAHLRRETELASFDEALNRRYIHACAAGDWPRWR
jgi:hypothetical protein